jgi:predicted transcriptional regulator
MAQKLSRELVESIRRLHRKRYSINAIAKALRVSPTAAWVYAQGFNSVHEYLKDRYGEGRGRYQRKSRSGRLEIAVSNLISERLEDLGMSQAELARRLGVSRQAVNLYVHKYALPRQYNLIRMFRILGVPYKTIDDL